MTNEYSDNNDDYGIDLEEQPSEEVDRLQSLFSLLQPGVTVLIERLQPSWCSGLLEEVHLDDSIGLDYFIETWGGQILSVKVRGDKGRLHGCYKINLSSYPPLVYGRPIKKHDKSQAFHDDENVPNPAPVPAAPVVVNNGFGEKIMGALPTVLPLVFNYMKSLEDKRQADMQMMLQMVRSNQSSGLSDITKIGSVMTQLNELFKSHSPASAESSEMDIFPQAMEVLKLALGNQNQQQQPRAKLTSPSAGPISKPPNRSHVPSSPANVTPIRNDVSDLISQMEPSKAAEAVLAALDQMPPDKRDEAMQSFLFQMRNQDDFDDDVEEDFEDETDSNKRGIR